MIHQLDSMNPGKVSLDTANKTGLGGLLGKKTVWDLWLSFCPKFYHCVDFFLILEEMFKILWRTDCLRGKNL